MLSLSIYLINLGISFPHWSLLSLAHDFPRQRQRQHHVLSVLCRCSFQDVFEEFHPPLSYLYLACACQILHNKIDIFFANLCLVTYKKWAGIRSSCWRCLWHFPVADSSRRTTTTWLMPLSLSRPLWLFWIGIGPWERNQRICPWSNRRTGARQPARPHGQQEASLRRSPSSKDIIIRSVGIRGEWDMWSILGLIRLAFGSTSLKLILSKNRLTKN